MILEVAADAPLVVRAAAAAVLWAHVGGAVAGLVSGSIALLAPKGGRLHRAAGAVFFVAMLIMASTGALVAGVMHRRIAATAGAFTFYLVATAWMTVRRPEHRVGPFEALAMLFALGIATTGFGFGLIGSLSPTGRLDGLPYQPAYIFAALATVGAAGDAAMVRAGGIFGRRRIARHAWRMGVALFVTAGSAAGQPKAVPEALRGSPILFVPMLAILALTLFWLIRARFTHAFEPPAASAPKAAQNGPPLAALQGDRP
jgi:uncharacterized membrane protein